MSKPLNTPPTWLASTLVCHTRELLRLTNMVDDALRDKDTQLAQATLQELHDALLAAEHVAMALTREPA